MQNKETLREALRCPEGHAAILHWEYAGDVHRRLRLCLVTCSEAFCWQGPARKTADEAIAAWNRRAGSDRLAAAERCIEKVRDGWVETGLAEYDAAKSRAEAGGEKR